MNDKDFFAAQIEAIGETEKDQMHEAMMKAIARYNELPVRVFVASNPKTGKTVEIEARSSHEASEKRAKNPALRAYMLEA